MVTRRWKAISDGRGGDVARIMEARASLRSRGLSQRASALARHGFRRGSSAPCDARHRRVRTPFMGRALSMKAAMLEDARLSSAIKRSNAAGREQTTARILLHGPTVGRLRFQPSRSAPSLPRPERAGREPRCPKASTPGRASQLDPLKIANGDPSCRLFQRPCVAIASNVCPGELPGCLSPTHSATRSHQRRADRARRHGRRGRSCRLR